MFAAGATAAAAGVAALGTAAVNSYADFEQLQGGIETLFGARGAKSVEEYAEAVGKTASDVQAEFDMLMEAQTLAMDNASKAYKNAGLSTNDYMETVTSFAASLKQSTENEVEAAKAADQAVIDMADNANKMGTSMESIQNAYQGFAKQNFSMLDNLKLGYGGTQEEMYRLMQDAAKLDETFAKTAEFGLDEKGHLHAGYADILDAIHIIQTEMGITGTTALEATETLSGSFATMNAAWSNLLTGIADDNADFDQLITNFVDSVAVVAKNLLPRVEIALEGVGELIEKLLPVIVEKIPEIVDTVLPDLLQSGINMLLTIGEGIIEALPELGETAYELIEKLVDGITDNADFIFDSGSKILLDFALGIAEALPELIWMAVDMILTLAESLTKPSNLENILRAGIKIISALLEGLFEALPRVIVGIGQIIANIIDTFIETDWFSIGENILEGIWEGILNGWDWLVTNFEEVAEGLVQAVQSTLMIHSPSRRFKWIGEMCIAGLDEPFEDYNPYETFQNSMKVNVSGLQSSFAAHAQFADAQGFDYEAIAGAVMDGIEAGGLTVKIGAREFGRIVREVT